MDLSSAEPKSLHSGSYCASLKARKYEEVKVTKCCRTKLSSQPRLKRQHEQCSRRIKRYPLLFHQLSKFKLCHGARRLSNFTHYTQALMYWISRQSHSFIAAIRGYCKIEIKNKAKRTFTTHHKIYCFVRMSIGTRNSLGAFQETMADTLLGLEWQFR